MCSLANAKNLNVNTQESQSIKMEEEDGCITKIVDSNVNNGNSTEHISETNCL